jgi:fucose permease
MAISGGAIIPPLYGAIVDNKKEELITSGLEEIAATAEAASSGYWILLPCYLIIFYYAFWGHKVGLKKNSSA